MKDVLINIEIRKDIQSVYVPKIDIPVLLYLGSIPALIVIGTLTKNKNTINIKAKILKQIPFDEQFVTLNIAGELDHKTKNFHIVNLIYSLKLESNYDSN